MSKNIVFTKYEKSVSDAYFPQPASKTIPDWYKKTKSYLTEDGSFRFNDKNQIPATIKKCIPVFDSITSGYIITTYCDLWIKKNNLGGIDYVTSSDLDVEFHAVEQAPEHPNRGGHMVYPKWVNPWSIKTPKGYSCLVIPPMHRENSYFSILPGIVDTDNFSPPINFPFVLKDVGFEGLIPAGTPLAQIIPFKRDSWKLTEGSEKEEKEIKEKLNKLKSVFVNRYKTFFWTRKEYR